MSRSCGHLIPGDRDAADADLERGMALADRLRHPIWQLRAKVLGTGMLLLDGRLDEAEAGIFDYLGYAEAHGLDAITQAGGQFYRLRYEQGRLDEFIPTLLQRVEDAPNLPAWRIGLAGAYTQVDELEQAVPHLHFLADDDFANVPRDGWWVLTVAGVARTAGACGELEMAAAAYDYAAPYTRTIAWSGNNMEQPVDLSLGVAARALGRLDDAERHFQAAIEVSEKVRAPTFVAISRLEWAVLLAERNAPGDAERAEELAGQALATAEELGLGRIRKRATALLA
jgi:tetratricopeptide (TPR) repeat protein